MNFKTTPPITYVISIAVGEYDNHDPLPNAVSDSKVVLKALSKYKVTIHQELYDEDVTSNSIEASIEELKNIVNER